MTEANENNPPPPEPEVMHQALVAVDNMEHIPPTKMMDLTPKVMPVSISHFGGAVKIK
jgi:hypothetical protein